MQGKAAGGAIVFAHVSKRYPGGQEALKDVSFSIEPGELVLVAGNAGVGCCDRVERRVREHILVGDLVHLRHEPSSGPVTSEDYGPSVHRHDA